MFNLGEFSFVIATRPETLLEIQRLRRRVFVDELGLISPDSCPFPDKETDAFDDSAVSVAALAPDGRVVGAARLILGSPLGLPAARFVSGFAVQPGERHNPAEISRIAIDAAFRGGVGNVFGLVDGRGRESSGGLVLPDGVGATILLGLMAALSQVSTHMGVTHWYLLSNRKLVHFLRMMKLPFEPAAPETDYFGVQTPFIAKLSDVEAGLGKSFEAKSFPPLGPAANGRPSELITGESHVLRAGGFQFFVARTSDLLTAIYRLRYQVFVEENAYDPPEHYPDKLLRDRYDASSFIIAALDRRGELAGTLRLIQNSPEGLPCLNWADPRYPNKMSLSRRLAEVSRLGVALPYRKYIEDVFYALLSTDKKAWADFRLSENPGLVMRERRKGLFILYGLFRVAFEISRWLRISTLYVVAGERLRDQFNERGIHFVPIGPQMQTGPRTAQPHSVKFQEIEAVIHSFGGFRHLARGMGRFVPAALPPDQADIHPIE